MEGESSRVRGDSGELGIKEAPFTRLIRHISVIGPVILPSGLLALAKAISRGKKRCHAW